MTADFLRSLQAECGGSIPFDKFMGAALYHPEFGYYTARVRTLGRTGDFSTWPGLHVSLAKAVASWLRRNPARHIIEVGAGTGTLAAGVLKNLGFFARLGTTCHIMEISPALRAAQQKLLKGRRVVWHRTIQEALAAAGGRANIYSNELPDAFPCRIFVRSEARWRELALIIEQGTIREVLRDAELPESSSLPADAPDGSRVEVHESYRNWLQSWSGAWLEGTMLTIDYGSTMPALYHRRPAGTIRAYAHHQRLTGPELYGSPGYRDITADVNFTDLASWGESLGWRTLSLGPLMDFIRTQCPKTVLPEPFTEAGEAFQALIQEAQRPAHER